MTATALHEPRQIPTRTSDHWLVMYVVYYNPSDYPDRFVVRRHAIKVPGGDRHIDAEPCFVGGTARQARGAIPEGLVRLDRHMEDDPAIIEVWV